MNVIFLTMSRITNIEERGIYPDLMRKLRNEGHSVYIVTPHERFTGRPTELNEENGVHILGVKTLNLQKTTLFEKGLGQALLEGQYKRAIRDYLKGVEFSLILYSTPPITFPNVIDYLKKNNPQSTSYLLLKDIFPQNAVDIGMMTKTGIKGLLYKYFRKKEERLYNLSDYIGCMSPANVKYFLEHNPEISPKRVEVAPNSLEFKNTEEVGQSEEERHYIRTKYKLPHDVPICIYGGNLGKPQGIPFLIECMDANANRSDCHFVVVGTGTELQHLKDWYEQKKPKAVTVMNGLPKEEYDILVKSCDVGLIFLDHRFTIPNYPSRILSYMENKMPVLCATDPNSDIGQIAEQNGYGLWCESNNVASFTAILDKMILADWKTMGEKGFHYFKEHYLIDNTYGVIMRHFYEQE